MIVSARCLYRILQVKIMLILPNSCFREAFLVSRICHTVSLKFLLWQYLVYEWYSQSLWKCYYEKLCMDFKIFLQHNNPVLVSFAVNIWESSAIRCIVSVTYYCVKCLWAESILFCLSHVYGQSTNINSLIGNLRWLSIVFFLWIGLLKLSQINL